ncbi:hypothetical protein NIES2104_67070 [Leptolyngbya sp. NIES-2104]|nr:hypothetical protein NIES2104_67070 [Leptolyngbya sp. NIES-2104]
MRSLKSMSWSFEKLSFSQLILHLVTRKLEALLHEASSR